MRSLFLILTCCFLAVASTVSMAIAQTASEIPLVNPEVLEPPSREQGLSSAPEGGESAESGVDKEAKSEAGDNADSKMTFARMAEIVKAIDGDAVFSGLRGMQLKIGEVPITIIVDERANRMRAFSAFKTLDGVDGQTLYRMMQANFDSALDARYAIAQGYLISVFIHPLGELRKDQFIEGLGQVANLVLTYGTAFTSGAMTFRGGDSENLHRKLIDQLLKKGEEI